MASPEQFFFELPIYRCSVEEHSNLLARQKERFLHDIGADPVRRPESYASAEDSFDKERWYPWRFNEVIGWIRLYRYGSDIRGELWLSRAKRQSPRGRKKYAHNGNAFQLHLDPADSDPQIAIAVLDELRRLQRDRQFKRRFIDLECFQTVAPFILWGKMLPPRERHA